MSTRRRLGVALLLDPPVATEVDGLRKALGDPSLEAMAPHITLVPPVNVREDALGRAEMVLREAAQSLDRPLELSLGPVATFAPVSPVVYLAVSGPDAGRLDRLHEAVLSGPLARSARFEWVPHVTLSAEATPDVAQGAVAALGCYRGVAQIDRVVLMEESARRWQPLADACLGRPVVVGRGGLEVEITEGRVFGPEARALASAWAENRALGEWPIVAFPAGASRLVLTARREGQVVGMAAAWSAPRPGSSVHVGVLVAPEARRQGIGRILLAALEASANVRDWAMGKANGHGPAEFYASCGSWVVGPSDQGPSSGSS